MTNQKHLPFLGIGPIYVVSISLLTIIAIVLLYAHIIPFVEVSCLFNGVFKVFAFLFVTIGIVLWVSAVFLNQIVKRIKQNTLVTNGVYAYVRHPIYMAFTFVEWGILLCFCNPYFLILIPLYWSYFTILIKNTEEKWLQELYGDLYVNYCANVNRCFPWFPKRKN